ncbi:MAG TPA: thymidine phosphorylase [Acidimicrobiia bacterium]|nr:thymidine phosphorylase [Acidimicrobiia bacterium]
MTYTAVELIEMKRDGKTLPADGIEWLIAAYTDGSVPDYQMAAMAMAILFNGMGPDELATWTKAMLHSGDLMDFSQISARKVDKHSTGGVGDKISIPLAPLVAACGVAVPMMSGRGLGHTGGTLDKLESIPGFTTGLDPERFTEILTRHGLVLAGQSATLAPADQKLYALRDTSGTVPSIPLISSSIMSKKLAEGVDGLLLDVKTGAGAVMKEIGQSRELARTMVGIGESYGVNTIAFITSMEQPLGSEVGNANEIMESIEVLRGEGPQDVTELTMTFAKAMLILGGIDGGQERLDQAIESGAALDKFIEVTIAHGGDPKVIEDPSLLARAPHEAVVAAPYEGYVTRCDALTIGSAAVRLGAGRAHKDDTIDPGVGISVVAKLGESVSAGDPLAVVRYSDESRWASQRHHLASAWEISNENVEPPRLVIERIEATAF